MVCICAYFRQFPNPGKISCLAFDESDPRLEQYHKSRMVVLFRSLDTDEEITKDRVELVVIQVDTARPRPRTGVPLSSAQTFAEKEGDGESEEEAEASDQAYHGLSTMPFLQPGKPIRRGHGGGFPTWILAVEVVVHEVDVLELDVV